MQEIKIFVSYSSKDRELRELLLDGLKGHLNAEYDIWDDTAIDLGANWQDEIEKALDKSNVALLLVSSSFVASNFINQNELTIFFKKQRENGYLILPVLLRKYNFLNFEKLSSLNFFKTYFPEYGFNRPIERNKLLPFDRLGENENTTDEQLNIYYEKLAKFIHTAVKNHFKEQIDKPQQEDTSTNSKTVKEEKPHTPSPKNFIQEVNAVDIEMIYVKGGKFRMGTKDWEHTQPIHPRRIADFYIGKYPITIEEYMDFVRETKSNHPEWDEKDSQYNLKTGSDKHYEGFTDNLSQPIVGVSWHNAVAYCKWLSKKTGKTFRLLSEAEWEYAAGGGSHDRTKYAGTENAKDLKDYAWHNENSERKTHPVGQKKPNQLGIHDMSGNVWEWCQDTWSTNYEDAFTNGKAYEGGDTSLRVLRGGSWRNISSLCRVAYRGNLNPTRRRNGYGFRIASSSPNVS